MTRARVRTTARDDNARRLSYFIQNLFPYEGSLFEEFFFP
jgi:hypothetical protein